MQIGNKFHCKPPLQMANVLMQWIGCQRFIYNAKVSEDRYFRKFARSALSLAGQYAPVDQTYSQFKTEFTPWLSDTPSQVLRNGSAKFMNTYKRFFKRLGGRPVIHTRSGKQSVWLTKELFWFEKVQDKDGNITQRLHIGVKKPNDAYGNIHGKNYLGVLPFVAHKEYEIPNSIHIAIEAERWSVSFNYDTDELELTEEEILQSLMGSSEEELLIQTVGVDRGVHIPLATSIGKDFGPENIQIRRAAKKDKLKKRYQRQLSKKTLGSRNWKKCVRKVAHTQEYAKNVQRDVAHKATCELANNELLSIYAIEALKIKNMTKRPKSKKDPITGIWLRNGRAAKAGLNKAILSSGWGIFKTYLEYKAKRKGKIVVEVPAAYSSQECASCGYISEDNRTTQSLFICQKCKHTDNADHNASVVIAKRGVKVIMDVFELSNTSGNPPTLGKKRKTGCSVWNTTNNGHTIGTGCSESTMKSSLCEDELSSSSKPVETSVSHSIGNSKVHGSTNQEITATTQWV